MQTDTLPVLTFVEKYGHGRARLCCFGHRYAGTQLCGITVLISAVRLGADNLTQVNLKHFVVRFGFVNRMRPSQSKCGEYHTTAKVRPSGH